MKKFVVLLLLFIWVTNLAYAGDYCERLKVWNSDCYSIWAQDATKRPQSAVVTATDWDGVCYGNWGEPGVKNIINTAAAGGVRVLWWRINNGGLLMYSSSLPEGTVEVMGNGHKSYQEYDPLDDAVKYAHQLGLKIYAWHCPLEESHSFRDQCRSRYADIHSELTDFDIDGNPLYVPSFYYKAYRDYKVSIIDEVLSRWALDGIALDFERRGAPFRDDRYGYVPALVKEYKDKTGRDPYKLPKDDPDWRAYRAQYFEKYIDGVKDTIERQGRDVKLVLMGTVLSEANAVTQLSRLTSERCDELAMRTLGPKGWPWAGDPKHAFCKINDITIPRSHVIYAYFDSKEVLMQKALESLDLGMTICWFETTPMYTRKKYSISSEIMMVKDIKASRSIALPAGSEYAVITTLGLCDWDLHIGSKQIAKSTYGKTVEAKVPLLENQDTLKLIFNASRVEGTTYRGLAANVKIYSGNNTLLEEINTDRDWDISSTSEKFQPVRVGQPGAFPFIEQTKNGVF